MVDFNLILNIFLGVLSYKLFAGIIRLCASKLQEKLEDTLDDMEFEEDEE